MKRSIRRVLFPFLAVLAAGCGLHFLYSLFPNPLFALISPVNESLWEHGKLVYFPLLAAACFSARRGGPSLRAWSLTISPALLGMLAAGWWYHVELGGEALRFDLALYAVVLLAAFLLAAPATRLSQGVLGRAGLALLAVWGILLVWFTFQPPNHLLFSDLSALRTWVTIPY